MVDVHNCPRCELRFAHRSEVEDHLRRDHPAVAAGSDDLRSPDPAGHAGPRLLAALDPDRPASPAAEVAARLARRTGSLLELVSVAPGDLPGSAVRAFLDAERRRQPQTDVVTTQLDGPEVVEALLGRIKEVSPVLVILDSHGRRPMSELILGSVSADLVRSSPAPTLLIGPSSTLDVDLRRLVIAVDGSADARGALDVAMDLARRMHFDVELVEVATGDVTGAAPPGDLSESSELRRLATRQEPPVDAWDVLHGSDIADALVDHVTGAPGTVLVMGTHGRSPGRPRVLGGVAAKAVRHAPVPVLLVSPEAAERHAQTMRPSSALAAKSSWAGTTRTVNP